MTKVHKAIQLERLSIQDNLHLGGIVSIHIRQLTCTLKLLLAKYIGLYSVTVAFFNVNL